MITIITCHPWNKSLNQVIGKAICSECNKRNIKHKLINLAEDKFNPVYSADELSKYREGKVLDELILKYQEILKQTTKLVFIFPIWWGTMPSILKGFFDKVMSYNFAFNYENGWTPLLHHIKDSYLITTSESPQNIFEIDIQCIQNSMLKSIGIENNYWINCDKIGNSPIRKKEEFINEAIELICE